MSTVGPDRIRKGGEEYSASMPVGPVYRLEVYNGDVYKGDVYKGDVFNGDVYMGGVPKGKPSNGKQRFLIGWDKTKLTYIHRDSKDRWHK